MNINFIPVKSQVLTAKGLINQGKTAPFDVLIYISRSGQDFPDLFRIYSGFYSLQIQMSWSSRESWFIIQYVAYQYCVNFRRNTCCPGTIFRIYSGFYSLQIQSWWSRARWYIIHYVAYQYCINFPAEHMLSVDTTIKTFLNPDTNFQY